MAFIENNSMPFDQKQNTAVSRKGLTTTGLISTSFATLSGGFDVGYDMRTSS